MKRLFLVILAVLTLTGCGKPVNLLNARDGCGYIELYRYGEEKAERFVLQDTGEIAAFVGMINDKARTCVGTPKSLSGECWAVYIQGINEGFWQDGVWLDHWGRAFALNVDFNKME